jgi:hypothetical protein
VEIKRSLGAFQWRGKSKRELWLHLGRKMAEMNRVTVRGRREGVNTPSGPNGRISAALPHSPKQLEFGTVLLAVLVYGKDVV